ncbi:GNAT family N-acetyltransferase [Pediococcus inopinatus]|uniref:GNAT family N-acetyltransferase n=1 Tax=Pediococcus inopinatus TaxID=114090 RepID=A0ABZ0Q4P9_9LACO|nr:GNAT family N-acetyltransferase [Pediococcus inopinatus]AVL00749.1 N-acetyltransferase [Pediococcus inopinatus]KRN61433.1 GCN5-like N-acetyltransferase [Pediococcus inopinatus]WPC16938.1 GNAT family N-acetyltransferase [Pediococcus inopinatus]WPC21644.1 GNAT family N-acetyltransferase [Pediococcus inopinatus]WPP09425.1 GNAT family N-acetyltransferase [Pediococcus inopinatus]
MKIIKLNATNIDLRPAISEIFVEGFYQWLKFFSKDKTKLAKAFAHAFNPEVFYAAVENENILGFAACTDGIIHSIQLDQHELRVHLGIFMGTLAYKILKKEFEVKPYPFEITSNMGTIEFVATSKNHRGQGVATQIIKYIHENTPFKKYVLEVADTNVNAVRLYETLNYQVFKRVPETHTKRSGINFYLYMQYIKST